MEKDLEEIENRNEAVMIKGDMNRAVGADEFGIAGNIQLFQITFFDKMIKHYSSK